MIFGVQNPEKIWHLLLKMTFFWISRGKVATIYRWGGQLYMLLMSNFLRILHTKNHKNGYFLTELFEK